MKGDIIQPEKLVAVTTTVSYQTELLLNHIKDFRLKIIEKRNSEFTQLACFAQI